MVRYYCDRCDKAITAPEVGIGHCEYQTFAGDGFTVRVSICNSHDISKQMLLCADCIAKVVTGNHSPQITHNEAIYGQNCEKVAVK